MTDYKKLITRLADELDHYRQLLMDDRREVHALATEARAALAKPQRRCLYSPVQIAECGGPCEQGPEHCDCGELCVTEPEPEEPTDEEIMELMPQQMHEDLAAAARAMAEQTGVDSIRVKGVMRIILNRHSVDLARAVLARWGK